MNSVIDSGAAALLVNVNKVLLFAHDTWYSVTCHCCKTRYIMRSTVQNLPLQLALPGYRIRPWKVYELGRSTMLRPFSIKPANLRLACED
jgi:hypothetical protein